MLTHQTTSKIAPIALRARNFHAPKVPNSAVLAECFPTPKDKEAVLNSALKHLTTSSKIPEYIKNPIDEFTKSQRPKSTLESLMKKWNQSAFAAGTNRNHISMCEEKLGIPLSEFITISLSAMQQHHTDLGL